MPPGQSTSYNNLQVGPSDESKNVGPGQNNPTVNPHQCHRNIYFMQRQARNLVNQRHLRPTAHTITYGHPQTIQIKQRPRSTSTRNVQAISISETKLITSQPLPDTTDQKARQNPQARDRIEFNSRKSTKHTPQPNDKHNTHSLNYYTNSQ